MHIEKRLILSIIIALLLAGCSSSSTETPLAEKSSIQSHFKKLITMESFEKAGVEHFGGSISMLLRGDELFILNFKDLSLLKYGMNNLQQAQRIFRARNGQAPKEMLNPSSLLFYDDNTIAVFDKGKSSVLFFDLDLNYKKETVVDNRLGRMARVGNFILSQQNYRQENAVAILNGDFKIVKTIIKSNQKIPFERYFPSFLNVVTYPGKNLVSHSYWIFPFKKCHVNIHNLDGKPVVKLQWEQPFTPTSKVFKEGRRLYAVTNVRACGSYYVVKCSYTKVLFGPRFHVLLIFDNQGTLKYKGDFPYNLIETAGDFDESKIYFKDDEEGVSSIDVTAFL
jgi:hypothetical protein